MVAFMIQDMVTDSFPEPIYLWGLRIFLIHIRKQLYSIFSSGSLSAQCSYQSVNLRSSGGLNPQSVTTNSTR